MSGLHIAKDLTLPIEVATDTSAILARKGAGKTYTGAGTYLGDLRRAGLITNATPITLQDWLL